MHKYIVYFFGYLGIVVSAAAILLFALIFWVGCYGISHDKCLVVECGSTYFACVDDMLDACNIQYPTIASKTTCTTYSTYYWTDPSDCSLYDPNYGQLTNKLTNGEIFIILLTVVLILSPCVKHIITTITEETTPTHRTVPHYNAL